MTLLRVSGVTVRFGGVTALERVDLTVGGGEVVGLIGPNGAGKSTLFNVLSGYVRPVTGEIWFRGYPLLRYRPDARARGGIGRTFQTPRSFAGATVLDNAVIAAEAHNHWGLVGDALSLPPSRRERARARERALDALDAVGLAERAGSPAGDLPLPGQRRLEIARALCLQPRLLLLDESASGLSGEETEELAQTLASLIDDRSLSVLLVEHDISFVLSLAHHVYVLEFGQVIAEGPPDQVIHQPEVITAYLGHEPVAGTHG